VSDTPVGDFQAGVDDCLLRLPPENRFGVVLVKVAPDTQMGAPPLALEVDVELADGRVRRIPVRARAWVNGYFEGLGRVDTCRSLLFPPDILAIVEPTVVVEQIAAHSVVRGVMCLLRHEQGCMPVS
jgi:hypothetical protein